MPCRINHKRLWAAKIILEQIGTDRPSSFVTLTYAPEYLPEHGSLCKEDIYAYKNRLRQDVHKAYGTNLRFFVVGEYGDKFGRPHYHMALFGLCPEEWEHTIRRHWKLGHVHVGDLRSESALYVAHYTTKKLAAYSESGASTKAHPPGVIAEFSSSSRIPVLGTCGAKHLVDIYRTQAGKRALEAFRMAGTFDFQGKTWPVPKEHRLLIQEALDLEPETLLTDDAEGLPNYVDLPMTSPGAQKNGEAQATEAERRRVRDTKARSF